jgi:hypothetical protein
MSTLDTAAEFLARTLVASAKALAGSDDLLTEYVEELGWTLPSIPPALRALQSSSTGLVQSLAKLAAVRRRSDEGSATDQDIAEAAGGLLLDLGLYASAVRDLPAGLRTQLPAPFIAATGIDRQFIDRLWNDSIERQVEREFPDLVLAGRLLGLIEADPQPADPAHFQPAFTRRRIRWDRIASLGTDPQSIFRDVYGWGTPTLNADKLLLALRELAYVILSPARFDYLQPALARTIAPGAAASDLRQPGMVVPVFTGTPLEISLGLYTVPKQTPNELQGLVLALTAAASLSQTLQLTPTVSLTIQGELDLGAGLALAFWPDRAPALFTSDATPIQSGQLKASIGVQPADQTTRLDLISGAGFKLDAKSFTFEAGVGIPANAGVDVRVEAGLSGARLALDNLGQDSFLAEILPQNAAVDFDVKAGWSSTQGLSWGGSAGLELNIPVHASIGPVTLTNVRLGTAAPDGVQRLELRMSASAALGPATVSIDGIGAAVLINTSGGNLGLIGVDFAALPPTGAGIAIDAGPVQGGGFLTLDAANGRYSGVLQLQIEDIAVTAFGLIQTNVPDVGFSLLIIISAQFSPIQLGFGFTLNGVGGLAGFRRTVMTDVLRAGLRTGVLDRILFPQNPIANGPQIINDLGTVFPPTRQRHIFGPIALIGWGTPTILEAKLGIVLELPSPVRLILLGNIRAALPKKESALVLLQMDFLGIIDFGAKEISLDGTLFDSRLASFPVHGDLAFRLNWGGQPNFAFSLGGFHPAFQPPPGFPALQRLTVALGFGDNPRITLQAYMALTSNTLQWGARAELLAEEAGFNIYGWIGYDVLFSYSPFSFAADFSAGLALRRGTSTIAGVHVDGTLSGPSPWHAKGEASLSLLFFDISVHFDKTFGDPTSEPLPPADAFPPLQAALQDPRSWSAVLSPGAKRAVTVASSDGMAEPGAGISVHQRVVPLNRTITKFGETVPSGADHFNLETVRLGSGLAEMAVISDYFAPAQFEDLSDTEKLSLPSFELMDAGATIGGNTVTHGPAVGTGVVYETIVIDPHGRRPAPPYGLTLVHQTALLGTSAASLGGLRVGGFERFFPTLTAAPKVELDEERFVIASSQDLTARLDLAQPATAGAAHLALAAHLAEHPEDSGKLQIVPADQVEAA